MSQNFVGCDLGQVLLLPPSLSDWLPEDHLAWTVLERSIRWIWRRFMVRIGPRAGAGGMTRR